MFAFRKHTVTLLLSGLTIFIVTQSAAAYDVNVRDAYGDEYGNVIVQDPDGPKMIFVGAAAVKSDTLGRELRKQVRVYKRAKGPAIISPPADPYVIGVIPAPNTGCDAPIVVRGRGYMYGIDRGEIPILGIPGCQ
ncbi:hypothetical protein [Phyllobacterium myrsinacearum]|uniref:Uncharacterized protein n=1 Tax=Phyllobacterium myrsinacearum TaxID=28101 RepID=A0A839EI78_9HYPH|nr:hypothetical protein [Phyllobacterium myrsinacearum]MBA8877965.1 hypothetical protein [Phyllobacterium myrsinacearum]